LLEGRVIGLGDRRQLHDAGIVHQHIDAAIGRFRRIEHPLHDQRVYRRVCIIQHPEVLTAKLTRSFRYRPRAAHDAQLPSSARQRDCRTH